MKVLAKFPVAEVCGKELPGLSRTESTAQQGCNQLGTCPVGILNTRLLLSPKAQVLFLSIDCKDILPYNFYFCL